MNVKLLDLQGQYLPLRNEIRRAIDEVCDQQALILGPHVERFEKKLAAYCQTKHAIGVSSGTDALLCSLMGIGIQPGDEVICPSFTFFATAGSIARLGAIPVFAEINPTTFNLDPSRIAEKITPKTKAIMLVHLFGQTADMTAINEIAAKHNLLVIEDAAQAIGAKHHGKSACSLGFAGCLSFYPTKNLGTIGEGGMVLTSDARVARQVHSLRDHGQAARHEHVLPGYNYRMPELQAAALRVLAPHLDAWNAARRAAAGWYAEGLAGLPVGIPEAADADSHVYHLYVIRAPERDALQAALTAAGIQTAIHYPTPIHLQPAYREFADGPGSLPNTEAAVAEILSLPFHPNIRRDEVDAVCDAVRRFYGNA